MTASARHGRALGVVVCLCLAWANQPLAQSTPAAAIFAKAGWDALAAGDPRAAADWFARALATDPKDAGLHLGAAIAAFGERRDRDALAAAERALDLDAALWRARELIGRVQYRSRDLDGAIRSLERLVADQPTQSALAETLARWRREAELRDRMQLDIGSRFTVAFEGDEDAVIAAAAIASLERASARIGEVLGAYPVASIPVVLYTAKQFRDITRAPDWAGGAFDGTVRIPVRGALASRAEFDRVLAHEFTHALVHALAPSGVPAWLDEGLAVTLQHAMPRRAARSIAPVPLSALTRPFGLMPRTEAERAYATSGAAVSRLIDEAGGIAVANLLRDLAAGVPLADAFVNRMQRTLADFDASLSTPR